MNHPEPEENAELNAAQNQNQNIHSPDGLPLPTAPSAQKGGDANTSQLIEEPFPSVNGHNPSTPAELPDKDQSVMDAAREDNEQEITPHVSGNEEEAKQRQAEELVADTQERLNRKGQLFSGSNQRHQYEEGLKKEEQEGFVEFHSQPVSLRLFEEHDLQEVNKLFVKPQDYDEFEQKIQQKRDAAHMFVMGGAESSGKMMAALYLAQRLQPAKGKDLTIHLFTDRNRRLLDVVHDAKLPQNSVVVFEEVFDSGLMQLDELLSPYLHLNEELNNVWFIFTVLEGPLLERLLVTSIPILHTTGVNRQQVIDKLIDEYFPEIDDKDAREKILRMKLEIDPSFTFNELHQLFKSGPKDIQDLIDKLRQKALSQDASHTWFSKLNTLNHKLYALMVVLFEKLDISLLEEIYTAAVNEFRRQGMDSPKEFIDPRRIGTNEMRVSLGLQVRYNTLEFSTRAYRHYTEMQIENFQRLLWSLITPDETETQFSILMGFLRQLSDTYTTLTIRAKRNPRRDTSQQRNDLRQLRSVIAVTIARVGVYHRYKLDAILRTLANDDSAFIALTPAFVFAEIAQRREQLEFIIETLRTWCRSGNFDLMWSTATSIAYIYEAITRIQEGSNGIEPSNDDEPTLPTQRQRWGSFLNELRDILTELAQNFHTFDDELIEKESMLRSQQYQEFLIHSLETDPDTWKTILKRRPFKKLNIAEQEAILEELEPTIKEAVRQDINMLVNSWQNRMRMVLVEALWQIALVRPRDSANLVRQWLVRKDTKDPLWQMGHMALNYLFQQSTTLEAPFLEQYAYPLLDLIPLAMRPHQFTLEGVIHAINFFTQIDQLASTGGLDEHIEVSNLLNGNTLAHAISALQSWYTTLSQQRSQRGNTQSQVIEDEDGNEQEQTFNHTTQKQWCEKVYFALWNALNEATPEERQNLRQGLFYWAKSGNATLNRMAHALLVHASIMDGLVLDLPTKKRFGVLLIDGYRNDREEIFNFIQSISTIAPLHLHWLGHATQKHFFSSNQHEDQETAAFGPNDLFLRGMNRPSLLIPIFAPRQGHGYSPKQCYFVAIFQTDTVLDLVDLCGISTERRETNQLRPHQSFTTASSPAQNQWHEKVYLLPAPQQPEQQELNPLADVTRTRDIAMLELQIGKSVATYLRHCTTSELWHDLAQYVGTELTRMPEDVVTRMEYWLTKLSDMASLDASYDVSLVILWTTMVLSLDDLEMTLQLIEKMLLASTEESDTKAAKLAKRTRHQIGMACTRMLFRFYENASSHSEVEQYRTLLHLLPTFAAQTETYTEMLPIFMVLFQWAESTNWLNLLNDSDGELLECLTKLQARDVRPFLKWLENYQSFLALHRLFILVKKPITEFRLLGKQLQLKYATPDKLQTALPTELEQTWLHLLPDQDNSEAQAQYQRVLAQFEIQQHQLLDPAQTQWILQGISHKEALITHISSELQTRLNGKVEILKKGDLYGLIMVDATSKEARSQAVAFLFSFEEQRRQGKNQHITLALHSLGSKEIITMVHNKTKIRKEKEIADKRKLVPVIGPSLERYPAEQVGFLLIITARSVIDYDDWAEHEQWATRLWVSSIGNWHPYGGEHISLHDNTPMALERIVQQVNQGRN